MCPAIDRTGLQVHDIHVRGNRSGGVALLLVAALALSAWSTCAYARVEAVHAPSDSTHVRMPGHPGMPAHCAPTSNAPASKDLCTLDVRAEQGVAPGSAAPVLERLSPSVEPVPSVLELCTLSASVSASDSFDLPPLQPPGTPIFLFVSVFLL